MKFTYTVTALLSFSFALGISAAETTPALRGSTTDSIVSSMPQSNKGPTKNIVAEGTSDDRQLQENLSVVNVLVIYTKGAACAFSGGGIPMDCDARSWRDTIELRILEAEQGMNLVLQESGSFTRVNTMWHLDESGFEPSSGTHTALEVLQALQNGREGLDYVEDLGADMVAMVTYGPRGGYANPSGYAAISGAALENDLFHFYHETGHMLGCKHQHAYSRGGIHTVMAGGGQRNTPRFSNTKALYNGEPIGDENHNCVKVIDARWGQGRV